MAAIEERFQAAVNVIKGLPKNGPYQPSTTMMLKFYGYYKQAIEGPCHQKKPAFWDVVGKAKWDAWNGNRHLSKQQAMQKYVDDLREIIETMSFTENVQNFVGAINGLDNINLDELDMVAPGMREMAESHPDSPFNSRTNSPQHGASANGISADTAEEDVVTMNGHGSAHLNGVAVDAATHAGATPPSTPIIMAEPSQFLSVSSYAMSNGTVDQSDDEYGDPVDMHNDFTEAMQHNSELLKQIQATVLRMNADLVTMNQRMGVLEKSVHEVRTTVQRSTKTSSHTAYPKWWPFTDISPAWFVLLVLWPFVVNRLSRVLITQRRK